MSLAPDKGARFLLERAAVTQEGHAAHYRASIHAPDRVYAYDVTFALGEAPQLIARGKPPEPAMEAQLLGIAKQVAKAAARNREAGLEPWPRRVLRWKGPGRGG
jgi:hypothetical protein